MKNPVSIILVVLSIWFLSGCNMWSGLGKDVQQVGKRMEEAGERHR
ncbi:MAG TPA: entericidin EcnA/B family protein [Methylococcaceae bacterium]|nr:entericidin EcnA/B family protein [Methylococcaceae bacterium]